MTASPGDGEHAAREGYYPDPSIPGYVRYWNGSAWVPGTSRPAAPGAESAAVAERLAARTAARVPDPRPAAPAAPAAFEETGPVFFDELPEAPAQTDGPSGPAAVPSDAVPFGGGRSDAVPSDAVPYDAAPSDAVRAEAVRADADRAERARADAVRADALPAARAEWAVDAAQQSGFGGDRDRKVSWGEPRPAADAVPAAPVALAKAPKSAAAPAASTGTAAQDATGKAAPAGEPAGSGEARVPGQSAAAAAGILSVRSPAGSAPRPAPEPEAPAARPAPAAEPARSPALPAAPAPSDDLFRRLAEEPPRRPAGLLRRGLARLLDSLVVGTVTAAVAVPLATRAADHVQDKIDAAKLSGETVTVYLIDGTTGGYLALVLGAFVLFGLLYEVLPVCLWGRTLGKALFRVRVCGLETQRKPSFGAALGRWLVYGLLGLLGVGVLGALWCLVDRPWKQGWHDKAAGTFVTR